MGTAPFLSEGDFGMARARMHFVCQQCGTVSIKWQGKCSDCGAWNSLVEEAEPARPGLLSPTVSSSPPVRLADVALAQEPRYPSGLPEFDRVAGGGLVPGSLLLVGGPPGIGKSTLLLQVAEGIGRRGNAVLYVTGEESLAQVRMRADRLGVTTDRLSLLSEIDLDTILARAKEARPRLLMIDSVQTLMQAEVASAPGSVSQVRECTAGLMRLAKGEGITVLLAGHVTKDGSLAGPRVMEHLVDTVLYFEGDGSHSYRVLKAVKNRFGPTHEVGLFEMREAGLMDVPNASEFFLAQRASGTPGSVVVPVVEGTRSMLVEVQALCTPAYEGSNLMRRAAGLEVNRVIMLLAVLHKRGGHAEIVKHHAFLNVAGGMEVEEPAADLGVLVAVASSLRDRPVAAGTAVLGEVGLGGEIRAVAGVEQRVAECARMGLHRIVVPASVLQSRGGVKTPSGVQLVGAATLAEALRACVPIPDWVEERVQV